MDFKIGDRVQLGGTGPMMTVEVIDQDHGEAVCVFASSNKARKPVKVSVKDLHKVKRFAIRAG